METMTPTQMVNRLMTDYNPRSKRNKGVLSYALELVNNVAENYGPRTELNLHFRRKAILNGAENRRQYSRGGNAEIYDGNIAERLCTESELKKTKYGQRKPNKQEERLDTQARALYQAEILITNSYIKRTNKHLK